MSGFPATLETWRKLQEMYTWWKRHVRNPNAETPGEHVPRLPAPVLAIAKEHIKWNAVGEVKLAKLDAPPVTTPGDTPAPTATDTPEVVRKVANFFHALIPQGSLVEISYLTIAGSGGAWVVTKLIDDFVFAVNGSEIAARSGTSCPSGNVTFWVMNTSGVLSSASVSEVAYNWTGGAIASGTLNRVRRHANGLLVVVGADCSGVGL